MHIASFQDGTVLLSDMEYAKGELHSMHPWDTQTCILDATKCACIHQFSTEMVYWEPNNAGQWMTKRLALWIKWSGFEPWLGHCVVKQNMLLS